MKLCYNAYILTSFEILLFSSMGNLSKRGTTQTFKVT